MSQDAIPSEWYFITPPQAVSWSKDSTSKTIDTYGTNNPYLNYGSTSLRKLTLGDVLVEGFSDGKEVENNIIELESCMRMVIDTGSGYAAPYCWNAYAGGKSYGIFIITSVNVTEQMRDLSGKATRAKVDIELQEVSPYQVNSGTDITSTAIQGSLSQEGELALKTQESAKQDAKAGAAKTGAAGGGAGGTGANATNADGAPKPPESSTQPIAPATSGVGFNSAAQNIYNQ
jgi:hypothetical protein